MSHRSRPVVLLYGGIIAAVIGSSKFHASFLAENTYDLSRSPRLGWAVVFAASLMAAAYAAGFPDHVGPRARQVVLSHLGSVVGALIGISAVQLAWGSPLLPRFVMVATGVATLPLFAWTVRLSRGAGRSTSDRDRVVVICNAEDRRDLAEEQWDRAERRAEVVAWLEPDEALATSTDPTPVRTAVELHDAGVVVLDRESQGRQIVVDQVALLHEDGVRVRTLALFYEEWLGKLPVGELERVSLMFDIGELHRGRYGRAKRLVDVAVGVCLLPALAVAVPFVWLGNQVNNRGPLFFSQHRVGKDGGTFSMLKFRSMDVRPEAASVWTEVDDDRVTPFGSVLRRSHLDELPQVLNILRGELSLIGPRPEQPQYVEQLETKLPHYQLRHLVQPGLTGWAQVKYGYARTERDALQKLQFEFFYLRHQSLWLDLRILARTVRLIFTGGDRP